MEEEIMPIYGWRTPASEIPAQQVGKYEIIKKPIGRGQSLDMEGTFGYDEAVFLEPTTITVLREKGKPEEEVIMSDAPMEYYSMWELVARTRGPKVLLGGLGLGILANLLASRPDIEEITVIEISPEIIQMVKPYLHPKVRVVRGDFLNPPSEICNEHFDTVICDIYTKEGQEELFEDAKAIMEDCWGDAVHLHWGAYQREYDKEVYEEFFYWMARRVDKCAEKVCEGKPDYEKCVSNERIDIWGDISEIGLDRALEKRGCRL
jgi:hypothetical protein